MPPSDLDSIHHDGSSRYVTAPAGRALRLGDDVTLRLRMDRGAQVERILLRSCPDGEQLFTEMHPAPEDAGLPLVGSDAAHFDAGRQLPFPDLHVRGGLVVQRDRPSSAHAHRCR